MSDLSSDTFQLLLDCRIIFLVRNSANVEARKVLQNKNRSMSRFELLDLIAFLYLREAYGGKDISLDSF